jgi:hypothetical protein
MGGSGGGRDDGELSWTNETLPLELRRALLDKALDDLRRARASGAQRQGAFPTPDRAGQSGAGRNSKPKKDKPRA